MNVPQQIDPINFHHAPHALEDGRSSARTHNEEVLLGTAQILWRGRNWIIASTVLALTLATGYLLVSKREYTAEAFVRLNFESSGVNSARVPVDAAIMVEGEARIVRSRNVAERVVERWRLAEQPSFATPPGRLRRLLNYLSGPGPDVAEVLVKRSAIPREKEFVWATDTLIAHTTVENDTRSYLIGIKFRWRAPETAAIIANTIAEEYLRERQFQNLFAAKSHQEAEVAQLAQRVGERHPTLISARSRLAEIDAEIKSWNESTSALQAIPLANFTVETAISAVPPDAASAPRAPIVFTIALVAGLLGSAGVLLLIERACAGLSSEQAAAEALGVRCLGAMPAEMPPDRVDPPLMRWMIYESVRAIVAAAALDVRSASCTVVLVTSSVPDEGKSLFTTTLAGVMADSGLRVLVLDAVPRLQPGASSSRNVSWSTMPDVDGEPFRTVALCVNERLPPSGHFEEELASARGRYDLILIKAPAVLMLSDAIRLARLSDVAVFLTHWRKTRVKTVTRAVHRLREAGIRLSGVVLTNVELPRSRSAQDPIPGYYLSSRQDEGGVRPGATI